MKHLKIDIREKNYIVPGFEDAMEALKEMNESANKIIDNQRMLDEMEYDAEKRQGEEV